MSNKLYMEQREGFCTRGVTAIFQEGRSCILVDGFDAEELKKYDKLYDEIYGVTTKAPTESRRKKSEKKHKHRSVSENKGLTSLHSDGTSKRVDNKMVKVIVPKALTKDSIDVVLEDLLEAQDFEGLRRTIHMLGYNIPPDEPNELELPEEWDLFDLREEFELESPEEEFAHYQYLKRNFANFQRKWAKEDILLQLEYAMRNRQTPIVRAILKGFGHDIPFKEDSPTFEVNSIGDYPEPE